MTSFALKIIVLVGMTANHAAYVFSDVLLAAGTAGRATHCVLFALGGVAFPIMAYLVVEGYRHTSSFRRYLGRLLAFAALTQVPWMAVFALQGGLKPNLNVLFALAAGLLLLRLYDEYRSAPWFPLACLGVLGISYVCDWGVLGPLMILLYYLLEQQYSEESNRVDAAEESSCMETVGESGPADAVGGSVRMETAAESGRAKAIDENTRTNVATESEQVKATNEVAASTKTQMTRARKHAIATTVAMAMVVNGLPALGALSTNALALPALLYATVGHGAAGALLCTYNGQRGLPLKWFFYAYYPAHIAVLGIVRAFLA